MKQQFRQLLSGALAALMLTTGAFAAQVTPSRSSITLPRGQNTASFDVVLTADAPFAGAEFGLKPSDSELTLSVDFLDVAREATVKTEKDGVSYFGFFSGSNKFDAGGYRIARVTCTYTGSGSAAVTLDSSKLVTIEDGKTRSDTSAGSFTVTLTREGAEVPDPQPEPGGGVTPPPAPVGPNAPVDPAPGGEVRFSDVPDSHWARSSIETVVSRRLFMGTGSDAFSPALPMTRGMFVTVLGRLAGVDPQSGGGSGFADVPGDQYYAPFIAWGAANGIVSGVSKTAFEPDRAVSRQEMALFLVHYCEYAGITLSGGASADFADAAEIAPWAADAVHTVSGAGLLMGTGNGCFSPLATASRAEVAALLARFVERFGL